eukprot:CAMPEP_0169375192 /NCGR_PEP_ID=MMETSP1017-20121227/37968_1 /TAXON_ID=342587 /ORGANISM="Karlodinium micrum, Strain CCMP2283" /LENGTH=161 /DNA_ID=CAMNT_0009474077 /DNA_START=147 /DNA_END=632 /DNA_ORIENTATION=-
MAQRRFVPTSGKPKKYDSLECGVRATKWWQWACLREVQTRRRGKGSADLRPSQSESHLFGLGQRATDPVQDHGLIYPMLHTLNMPQAPRPKPTPEEQLDALQKSPWASWRKNDHSYDDCIESAITTTSASLLPVGSSLEPYAPEFVAVGIGAAQGGSYLCS